MIILKHVRRKNRKIKFDEDRYIEKYYMNENKVAVIPVELESERDLYMKHDYLQMELSDEVCAYIEEIAYMIPIDADIILEIHCPKLSKFKQDKMKRAIKNNFGLEIDDIEYDLLVQDRKSIILFIVGIILLAINIMFDKALGSIISNFLCVVWWVAIWDFIEMQIFDRIDKREQRLCYQQLYDSEVTFVFDDEEKES